MRDERLETFYRALPSPDHFRRWNREQFTSSHHSSPGDWEQRFEETNGSLNEDDYDRVNTHFGEMSPKALRAWLMLKREGRSAQTKTEKFEVGEVPGVCAFRTARQALEKYNSEDDFFVAFRGRYISPCMPEVSEGAVVATVEEPLCSPLPRLEFKRQFD